MLKKIDASNLQVLKMENGASKERNEESTPSVPKSLPQSSQLPFSTFLRVVDSGLVILLFCMWDKRKIREELQDHIT